jgi:hypothetical protein
MTRTRKIVAVFSWVLAVPGGGWALLTLLSAYMTTTGYLHREDVLPALPLPLIAMLLALTVHVWRREASLDRVWPWCVPVYVVAGGPVFLLVTTWLDQQYNK